MGEIIHDLICSPLQKALKKAATPKGRKLKIISVHPTKASVEKRRLSDWPPSLVPVVEGWLDTTPGEVSMKLAVVQLELDKLSRTTRRLLYNAPADVLGACQAHGPDMALDMALHC